MICNCLNCINNENGYCLNDSYVMIEEDGMCDSICIVERSEEEIENNETH